MAQPGGLTLGFALRLVSDFYVLHEFLALLCLL